ncbi:Crp/Fnr family transcriptional regulator [Acinetobacter sp. MD2(2019)]|uniref:Crp/Fnr family transcriptional regulator n=1 Tax=Acinetobacter sp. MD2(2019) TaxID=2605273 RepID=UPI002D1F48A7|nr:Crp/Fnr family transcriptional regulator [Acinetobacter sp. MD2(2019)]MEB3754971.1 Crp/Fnr family transcriptional regulator [Acinetobacter sp. MD2(2019)]
MTALVYNRIQKNNYDHFLDLLDQTHFNRYQGFNITSDYKKIAEKMFSDCEFIAACSLEEKQKLFNEIKIKHLYQGQVLYSRHQHCREVIIILSGVLKLGWNSYDGKYLIHRFIPTGALLNVVYLISESALEHEYIAHEPTVIASIPEHIFKYTLQHNPRMLYQVLKLVCQRTRLLDNDIYHTSTQPLKVQIARQLIYLVEFFSTQTQQGIEVLLKLSQENLAELFKISRQSIRKEIQWFVEEGILETKYNHISVKDINKLKAVMS